MQEHFDKVFNSVVKALRKDATRTFTHYEVRFFSNWYNRQNQQTKDTVQNLIRTGRLEIVNGGWDVHDTVCPHYADILLNMQRGKQWLKQEFNYAPRAAWSLDQNGNSDTNARLMGESGAEALFIRHIDPQDRDMRLKLNLMEFVWRPDFYHSGNRD